MKATTASRLRWGLLAFVTLIAATLLLGYCMATSRPGGNPPEVTLVIPKGATREDVMARLEAAHLVERPWVTALVFRIKGVFANLRAGAYKVPGDANALELADLLANGEPGQRVTVTIIPGQSVWELADRVAAAGAGTRDEVLTLAADRAWVAAELARAGGPALAARAGRTDGVPMTWLEGFAFPETYWFDPGVTAREVLARAIAQFGKEWRALAAAHGATLRDLRAAYALDDDALVTLASLVEEETRDPSEAARIAGVFYNRLAKKMRLETDPTLMYRPDRVARPPAPAERRDATNPYNTYAHAGLPPGPICSPGRGALAAALAPERHGYLFFVAKRDGQGGHAFAETFDEHRANIRRYLSGGGDARPSGDLREVGP